MSASAVEIKMEKAVVLLSGGMDSATLAYYIRKRLGVKELYSLSFSYGQKHARELEMARRQAQNVEVKEHRVLDIFFFGGIATIGSALTDASVRVPDLEEIGREQRMQPPTYVPNRNMTFLSIGAAFAESRGVQDVFYGAQAQDEYGYWDCSVDFVRKMNEVLALNRRYPVKVHAPFAGLSKADVLKMGLELGVDYGQTWTCYRGGEQPCGTCPSCVERKKAFEAVGIVERSGSADIQDRSQGKA